MNECGLCGANPKGVGTAHRTECDPKIHWVMNNWKQANRLTNQQRRRRKQPPRRSSR